MHYIYNVPDTILAIKSLLLSLSRVSGMREIYHVKKNIRIITTPAMHAARYALARVSANNLQGEPLICNSSLAVEKGTILKQYHRFNPASDALLLI